MANSPAQAEKRLFWAKNKAGSLPLSCPPSRFLSYPKIPLSGKMFVVDRLR
jgi:hypothetical protein